MLGTTVAAVSNHNVGQRKWSCSLFLFIISKLEHFVFYPTSFHFILPILTRLHWLLSSKRTFSLDYSLNQDWMPLCVLSKLPWCETVNAFPRSILKKNYLSTPEFRTETEAESLDVIFDISYKVVKVVPQSWLCTVW